MRSVGSRVCASAGYRVTGPDLVNVRGVAVNAGRPIRAITLTALLGCSVGDQSVRQADIPADAPPPGMVAPAVAFCTDVTPVTAAVTVAPLLRASPSPDETGVQVRDVAVGAGGRLVMLDASDRSVVVHDPATGTNVRWGREGDGPGEFRNPTAIATSPKGRIYVLDRRRISVFTADGEYLHSLRAPIAGTSMAVLHTPGSDVGAVAVADWVDARSMLPRSYVVQLDEATGERRDLLNVTGPEMLEERPYTAPMTNRLSLTGVGTQLAVWYHYDPYVRVFRDGVAHATIAACFDEDLKSSYGRQAREGGRTYQRVVRQTAGLGTGSDGSIWLVQFDGTQRRAHLLHYSASGAARAAYTFDIPDGTRLRPNVTFIDVPHRFISWDGQPGESGDIDLWTALLPASPSPS
jgi:hypothetical protein